MAGGRTTRRTRRTRRRQVCLVVPGAVLVTLLAGQQPSCAAPRSLPEVQF